MLRETGYVRCQSGWRLFTRSPRPSPSGSVPFCQPATRRTSPSPPLPPRRSRRLGSATIKQLPDLASKLSLPDGWTYETEVLTEPLVMNSNGLATVVNDDFYNSYQLRS
jgi:hypothetical protein